MMIPMRYRYPTPLSLEQQDDKVTLEVRVVDDPNELPQLKSPTGKDYLMMPIIQGLYTRRNERVGYGNLRTHLKDWRLLRQFEQKEVMLLLGSY